MVEHSKFFLNSERPLLQKSVQEIEGILNTLSEDQRMYILDQLNLQQKQEEVTPVSEHLAVLQKIKRNFRYEVRKGELTKIGRVLDAFAEAEYSPNRLVPIDRLIGIYTKAPKPDRRVRRDIDELNGKLKSEGRHVIHVSAWRIEKIDSKS